MANEIDEPTGAKRVRQDRALEVLLTGGSHQQAADAAGVNRRTLAKWLEESDFRVRLEKISGASVEEAKLILEEGARDAAKTIVDQVREGELKAAQTLLDRVGVIRTERREQDHSGLENLSRDQIKAELRRTLSELEEDGDDDGDG